LWLEYHCLGGGYTHKQRVKREIEKLHDQGIEKILCLNESHITLKRFKSQFIVSHFPAHNMVQRHWPCNSDAG
jgi:hypothetical protein